MKLKHFSFLLHTIAAIMEVVHLPYRQRLKSTQQHRLRTKNLLAQQYSYDGQL